MYPYSAKIRSTTSGEKRSRKEYEAAREFYNKHRDIQEALVNADAFDDTYTKYDEDGGFRFSRFLCCCLIFFIDQHDIF